MTEPDNSLVIFNITPPPIPTTARDIGMQLSQDSADKQAAILVEWAVDVGKYGPRQSWAFQCNNIAAEMTQEQRIAVKVMLGILVEHL